MKQVTDSARFASISNKKKKINYFYEKLNDILNIFFFQTAVLAPILY